MAGHFGRHLLHPDKEVEKFSEFRENLIKHYKWNLRSAGFAVLFLAAIPVGLTYVGYKYQSLHLVAAKREEPIFEKHNNWVPRS
ncbi:hypothetical protein PICMEDRAFT_16723 [Pichia membranifaciens NRRL Y-2026]|uniref:NADH dehydrogenase [ubiquinone] 1 beta subcomplex subunit 4 n=1 Tax=Pichia membranifaciens NRRL Y-2026 TaxID=763406 RepID=A0A1E3NLG5_9ASCO|nr:hypothetical protein PICMEDRAFT_16723 [Pichia membranifaciens NRRL Y-2026]ODQ46916.1 hypothetical protein PICMEDRAFT_16723 [Pichia membranifaciens NRRL Y-2026]